MATLYKITIKYKYYLSSHLSELSVTRRYYTQLTNIYSKVEKNELIGYVYLAMTFLLTPLSL